MKKRKLTFSRANYWRVFERCCTHDNPVSCRKFRELMWEKYHKLCASASFKEMWTKFLDSFIGIHWNQISCGEDRLWRRIKCSPLLCWIYFEISKEDRCISSSYEERIAIVCRGFAWRLEYMLIDGTIDIKRNIFDVTVYISKDDNSDRNGSQLATGATPSSDWTLTTNWGDLIIVNELIYNLFVAIEQEVRKHLSINNAWIWKTP